MQHEATKSTKTHEGTGCGLGSSGPARSFRGKERVDEAGRWVELHDGLDRPPFPADGVEHRTNSFVRLRALRGFVRYLIQIRRTPRPSRRAAPPVNSASAGFGVPGRRCVPGPQPISQSDGRVTPALRTPA